MKLKTSSILWGAALMLLAGCGGGHHETSSHSGKLVFKGTVVQVSYHLTDRFTILLDADGKTTRLEGFPNIPCSEIEVYSQGNQEYEVFRAKEPLSL